MEDKKTIKEFISENKGKIIKVALIVTAVAVGVVAVKYGLAKRAGRLLEEGLDTVGEVTDVIG